MRTLLCLAIGFTVFSAMADESVKGYFKKDGTYVEPHYRSSPNERKDDNYSSKGNENPYTGKKGYVDPYAPAAPKNDYDFGSKKKNDLN